MPKRKPVVQYATLDVLLMYLLGYKQKVVRIRKDAFDYHSYWFSKQPLRCVAVEIITDKQGKQWVVLTHRNQQAIQNHLTRFFVLYEQDKAKTPYNKLVPIEWDLFLRKVYNRQILTRGQLTFSFFAHKPMLPYGSDACAFHCMAKGVYAAIQQMEERAYTMLNTFTEVVAISMPEKGNDAYITFKLPKEKARMLLLMLFGYPFMHWRIRLFSRKASYKYHPLDFHSAKQKEKKLLDLLVRANGRVSVDLAANVLGMETDKKGNPRTRESIEHSLQSMGNEIHGKAVRACKGRKDTVDFIISVADGWVTMENDAPIK